MTKHIDPRKLSKSVLVKSHSFSGATIEDLEDHVKPVLRRKPDSIILHAGTNNLQNDSLRKIKSKVEKLTENIKKDHPAVSIAISSIIQRDDKPLNDKVYQVNQQLKDYCEQNNLDFIDNSNIRNDGLNAVGLHLNRKGVVTLAANLRQHINY